jgi:hypothetical protein
MSAATEVRYCKCGLPFREVNGTYTCVHCDRVCMYNDRELCARCKTSSDAWTEEIKKFPNGRP